MSRAAAAKAPARPQATNAMPLLDGRTFRRLAQLVDESCGITMSDVKRTMLETRLRRRLQANGLAEFAAYADLLETPEGRARELQAFVDCVVTNQTAFFREPPHFDHLTPAELTRLAEEGPQRSLRIWSAASSSGQEAYSLAMVADAASNGGRQFDWSVLATDISVRMLSAVRDGVYSTDDVEPVPMPLRQRYLKSTAGDRVAVSPELKRRVRIGQVNLMHERFMPGAVMDIIFCRNVLIYFKPEIQRDVVAKLCGHLRPGGLLVLGHSESIRANDLPLRLMHCNIHERLED